jgi:hypothetical protein
VDHHNELWVCRVRWCVCDGACACAVVVVVVVLSHTEYQRLFMRRMTNCHRRMTPSRCPFLSTTGNPLWVVFDNTWMTVSTSVCVCVCACQLLVSHTRWTIDTFSIWRK